MRNLNREAWFLNYMTSIPHYENCAQSCEDFADLFNRLLTGHGVHGMAKLDFWVSRYLSYAQTIRREAEFVRHGDYMPIQDTLRAATADYRGMMEQPLRGWMSEQEMAMWEASFDRLASFCSNSAQALENANDGGSSWLERAFLTEKILNLDRGFVGDYEDYFIHLQTLGVIPTLPAWPEYQPDLTVSCSAGQTCPQTGVWIPQQAIDEGLQDFSVAFAVKGRPMQAAYRIRLEQAYRWLDADGNGEFPYIDQVTTIEDAVWHPLIEVQAPALALEPPHRGRVEGNEACPRSGYWWTLAQQDSRKRFAKGELMPDYPSSRYGAIIWYWDAEQGEA